MKIKSLLVGIVGGAASGLTGIGGGTVMVPLLTGLLQMPQRNAHGTSLAIVIFVGIAAVIPYVAESQIQWPLVFALGVGAIVGAQIGTRTMHNLPDTWLRLIFASFLFIVGRRMIFLESPDVSQEGLSDIFSLEAGLAFAIGFVGGAFGGLLGIGGGTLFVPALVLLVSVPQHTAQGISLVVVVLTALSGTFTNVRAGFGDKNTVIWVAPAAVILGFCSGILAQDLQAEYLTRLFGLVVVYVGGRTVLKTWSQLRER